MLRSLRNKVHKGGHHLGPVVQSIIAQDDLEAADSEGSQRVEALSYRPS